MSASGEGQDKCGGQHHFYVAQVIGIESEGRVVTITVCTSCGEFRHDELTVSKEGSPLRLLIDEDEKKG